MNPFQKQTKLALFVLTLFTGLLSGVAHGIVPAPYGAIAYSPTDGALGIARKTVNQEAAEQLAMGNCAITAHGKSCRIVVWFYNACAALAKSPNGDWGADYASTTSGEQMEGINAAYAKARQHCEDAGGGTTCQLVQATCSFDGVP